MRILKFGFLFSVGALLVTACHDIGPNSGLQPVNIYLSTDQQTLDRCGVVTLGNERTGVGIGPSIPVENTVTAKYMAPYHLSPQTQGYVKSTVRSDEYDAFPTGGLRYASLKRAGSYVYEAEFTNRYDVTVEMKCASTGETHVFRNAGKFTLANPPGSGVPQLVFRISSDAASKLSATFTEYPIGATPSQMNLP